MEQASTSPHNWDEIFNEEQKQPKMVAPVSAKVAPPQATEQASTSPPNWDEIFNEEQKQPEMVAPVSIVPPVEEAEKEENIGPTLQSIIGEGSTRQAITDYYTQKGFKGKPYEAMVDQWKRDMRYSQNNSLFAGLSLNEVYDAKEDKDLVKINNIKTMREAWDRVPGMFSKGGDDILPAMYENLEAGILDPLNVLSAGAGIALAPAKSMAVKIATAAAIDALTSGSIDALEQNVNIEVGLQDSLNEGRLATAALFGAALPATVAGTAYAVGVFRDVLSNIAVRKSASLSNMNANAAAFYESLKNEKQAEAFVKGITFVNNNTEFTPWKFISSENMSDYAVGGKTKYFNTPEDAATFAEQAFLPNTPAGTLKPGHIIIGTKTPIATHWRLVKQSFTDIDEADAFIKKNGAQFGSVKPGDYTKISNDVAGVNGGMMQPIELLIQKHADKFYRLRQIIKEALLIIKERQKITPNLNPHYGSVINDNALMMAENVQNSTYIASGFVGDTVFRLAPDKNKPDVKGYFVAKDTPALGSILLNTGNSLREQGVEDPNFANELVRYLFAKRAIKRETDPTRPINTGVILRDTRAFIKYVEDDHIKAPIYAQAADQIKTFNRSVLQFGVDHDYISAEHMSKMLAANDMFMPFRRLEDFGASYHGIHKGSAADTTRKWLSDEEKMRGQKFLDPLEAYKQEIYAFIRNAAENRANLQMYRTIEASGKSFANRFIENQTGAHKELISVSSVKAAFAKQGINIQVTPQTAPMLAVWVKHDLLKNKPDVDFVYDGGKVKFYKIKDMMLLDAVITSGKSVTDIIEHAANATSKSWQSKFLNGGVATVIRSANEIYSTTITHDPSFLAGAALPADSIAGYILDPKLIPTRFSDLPFINAARGLSKSMDSPEYKEFMANGGGMSGMRANNSVRQHLIKQINDNGLDSNAIIGLGFDSDSTIMNKIYSTVMGNSGLATLGKKVENSVRFNTYLRHIERGGSMAEAGNAGAKYSVDFRLRGTSMASTQAQRMVAPFTRATVNALYQNSRLMLGDGKDSAARLFKMGIITLPPAIGLHYLLKDSETYQALPDTVKDMYWFVPVGTDVSEDGFLKVRKPHELAIVSNLATRTLVEMEKNEEGKILSSLMAGYFFSQLGLATRMDNPIEGFLPPAAVAVYAINTGQRNGIPINSRRDEGSFPERRGSGPYLNAWLDSEDFRTSLGAYNSVTNSAMTPRDMEVFVAGTFGNIARYSLGAMDNIYKSDKGTYKFHFSSLPVVNRIYQSTRPVRNTGLDDKIYAYDKYVTRVANDLKIGDKFHNVNTIEAALEKLNEAGPKYMKHMAVATALKDINTERTKFETAIISVYNTSTNDPNLEDRIDDMFRLRNRYLQERLNWIQETLRRDPEKPKAVPAKAQQKVVDRKRRPLVDRP